MRCGSPLWGSFSPPFLVLFSRRRSFSFFFPDSSPLVEPPFFRGRCLSFFFKEPLETFLSKEGGGSTSSLLSSDRSLPLRVTEPLGSTPKDIPLSSEAGGAKPLSISLVIGASDDRRLFFSLLLDVVPMTIPPMDLPRSSERDEALLDRLCLSFLLTTEAFLCKDARYCGVISISFLLDTSVPNMESSVDSADDTVLLDVSRLLTPPPVPVI